MQRREIVREIVKEILGLNV